MFTIGYLKEKDGVEVIETEGGFLAYLLHENAVGRQFYISALYLAPDFRASPKHFTALMERAEALAEKHACTCFTCHVEFKHKRASELMAMYLKYGFGLHSATATEIALIKELPHG